MKEQPGSQSMAPGVKARRLSGHPSQATVGWTKAVALKLEPAPGSPEAWSRQALVSRSGMSSQRAFLTGSYQC